MNPAILTLLIAFSLSSLVVVSLQMFSLVSFTRTGPAVKNEITSRYRWFVAFSIARHSLIGIIWLTLLALPLALAASEVIQGQQQWLAALLGCLVGWLLMPGIRLLELLYHNPAVIIHNSQYRPERWSLLREYISPLRLRVLKLMAAVVLFASIAVLMALGADLAIWIWILLVASLLLWLDLLVPANSSSKPQKAEPDDQRPNLIMIGCDTLRADCIGDSTRGSSLTPNLDQLCKLGIHATNMFTPIARTAPSLASIMSGLWPHHTGIYDNFDLSMSVGHRTLAHKLKLEGYRTKVISDWAGSDFSRFDFGFEEKFIPKDQWNIKYLISQGTKEMRLLLSLFSYSRLGQRILPEIFFQAGVPLNDTLVDTARDCLNELANDPQPFFLNLFLSTAHPPFASEHPYFAKYADPEYRGPSRFSMAKLTDPEEIIRSQQEPKDAFDLDQVMALYHGCVNRFDDAVGQLVQAMHQLGIADNTLFMIYSDHGIDFFEKNSWGQGNTIYSDSSYRIPFILCGPGVEHQTLEQVTRSIDIAPTLAELLQIELDWPCDGVSLLSETEIDRYAYMETGLWLALPPGMPEQHLTYPNILELLDVPDIASGIMGISQQYQQSVLNAKDRAVIQSGYKLTRVAMSPAPDWQLSAVAQVSEDRSTSSVYTALQQLMQPHLPPEIPNLDAELKPQMK